MNWRQRTTATTIGAALITALAIPAAAQDSNERFRLIDLGSLGGDITMAFAVNQANGVVGVAETLQPIPEMHPFYWSDGELYDLGTLGGGWGEARDINDSNLIVGASETAFGEVHAFYYYNGRMFDVNDVPIRPAIEDEPGIGELGGGGGIGAGPDGPPLPTFIEANAINNFGFITGAAQTGNEIRAFLLEPGEGFRWDEPNFVYHDLGTLPTPGASRGIDINEYNQVVGVSGDYAFFWANGHMEPVGGFADIIDEATHPTAISNDEFIAGWVMRGDIDEKQAVVWTPDVYRVDLPTGGSFTSIALDMNNSGLIVGWVEDNRTDDQEYDADRFAVLWEGWCLPIMLQEVIRFESLTPVGWEVIEAPTSINDSGWIAGWGRLTNGEIRAFLLEPIQDND